jgi:hypothetical protein
MMLFTVALMEFVLNPGLFSRIGVTSTTGMWSGDGTPAPSVALLIDEGDHHYLATRLPVPLMAGWG